MTRLACGVNSDDEAGDHAPKKGPGRTKSVTSLQQQQQFTVAQSGRKFAVRQLDAKMQNIELGRWFLSSQNLLQFVSHPSASLAL